MRHIPSLRAKRSNLMASLKNEIATSSAFVPPFDKPTAPSKVEGLTTGSGGPLATTTTYLSRSKSRSIMTAG